MTNTPIRMPMTPTGTSAVKKSRASCWKLPPTASRNGCSATIGRCSKTAASTTSFTTTPVSRWYTPRSIAWLSCMEPSGIKIHRLTDGAYERNGLTPEDTCDEPENRRGPSSIPLKPQAWNALSLRIEGDTVKIDLNGQPVYERRLEPENQRSFGLFHYIDETSVRVRNVTYQGNWAKSIPESLRSGGK